MPELLAPAGNPEKLATALTYGADAIYLGGPGPNLRAPGAGFADWAAVAEAVATAHAAGSQAYLCLNALPTQTHLPAVEQALEHLADLAGTQRPDALIVADPGVLHLARRHLPQMPLHLSTQANTANAAAASFWAEQGATRVNLARELTLADTRAMAAACPGVELEAFVHGAMCMAVSGRCTMSAHLNRRSANLGLCTHPCRFQYRATATRPLAVRLEEAQRPGRDTWEVLEQDGFTSVLAAEDLCLARYLPWFARVGLTALKIEGRMKSGGYLAHTVDVYATALADFARGAWRPELYMAELLNTASRTLATGFFLPGGRQVAWAAPAQQRPVLGRINRQLGPEAWEVAVRARWNADAPIAIMVPGLQRPTIANNDYTLEDAQGARRTDAHSGTTLTLRCPHPALRQGLFLRAV